MKRPTDRPRDLNQLAARIVQDATGGEETVSPESPQAVAGRLGGLKGGIARAGKLTAKQRSEIARKAARARWSRPD